MTETIIGAILAAIVGALGMRLWSGHRERQREAAAASAGFRRAKQDEAREVTAARETEAAAVARVEAEHAADVSAVETWDEDEFNADLRELRRRKP